MMGRIKNIINVRSCDNVYDAVNLLEQFVWQENQSKWNVNAIRVYDFWGYEWRLPYWDKELIEFWRKVPLEYRIGKRLRNIYVEKVQGMNIIERPKASIKDGLKHYLIAKDLYSPEIFTFIKRKNYKLPFLKRRMKSKVYFAEPHGYYGIVPFGTFQDLYSGGEDINSFLALEQLKTVSSHKDVGVKGYPSFQT